MYRCVHNVKCVHSVLVTKYVFIVHCVYGVCVCVLCTLSSVQSVNMYCLYVNCFVFLHCLEHALKNFTHQGTRAVVM